MNGIGVWNDRMLRQACIELGLVDLYDPACINPASIDLRLGNTIRRAHQDWRRWATQAFYDGTMTNSEFNDMALWGEPYEFTETIIDPGEFVLCHSMETVRVPLNASALLFSKSSMGRVGLEHSHAGLGDPGFVGQWTWEWSNIAPWPIKVYAGKRYMQMQLYTMAELPERDYSQTGRYQNQTGATPAREARL